MKDRITVVLERKTRERLRKALVGRETYDDWVNRVLDGGFGG